MEKNNINEKKNFFTKTIKEFTDFFTGKYELSDSEKEDMKRSGNCRCCRGCGDCGRGKIK